MGLRVAGEQESAIPRQPKSSKTRHRHETQALHGSGCGAPSPAVTRETSPPSANGGHPCLIEHVMKKDFPPGARAHTGATALPDEGPQVAFGTERPASTVMRLIGHGSALLSRPELRWSWLRYQSPNPTRETASATTTASGGTKEGDPLHWRSPNRQKWSDVNEADSRLQRTPLGNHCTLTRICIILYIVATKLRARPLPPEPRRDAATWRKWDRSIARFYVAI